MEIVYGFSDRRFGDMRNDENLMQFLDSLGAGEASVVWPRQVHGSGIAQVGKADAGQIIPEVDGLIAEERDFFWASLRPIVSRYFSTILCAVWWVQFMLVGGERRRGLLLGWWRIWQ